MANILQRGAAWLGAQLLANAASSISIDTGSGSPTVINAVIGGAPRGKDGSEAVDLIHSDRDFSVLTSALPSDPARTWRITFLTHVYRVVDWEPGDAHEKLTRLKTVLVVE